MLRDIHMRDLKHCGGVNTLLAEANRKYCFMNGRAVAQRVLKSCPWCLRRANPKPLEVASAPLHPNRRGLAMRPFSETGVDMAGPFLVRHGKTRANVKIYSIIFVCCATRAVNIEAVEEASTRSCRMAFERHCARYGKPEVVYSDNGKNFVGLHNSLQAQYKVWTSAAGELQREEEEIEWRFAPPYSPRWNGHVEIMVKLFKKTLNQLLYQSTKSLRTEEFSTLCTVAAGYMNRRPLVQVGSPGDREVLTPAHFLLAGNPYLGFGPKRSPSTPLGVVKAELEQLSEELWARLENEYLKAHRRFAKQTAALSGNLERGSLVLVLTEKTPQGLWPIGTILETRVGKDQQTRKFRVGLGNKTNLIRSAAHLAPIKIDENLPTHRLTFGTKLFRPGWAERAGNRVLEEWRHRALELLASRTKYEEARRLYAVHTGRDPGRVLRKGRRKGKMRESPADMHGLTTTDVAGKFKRSLSV